jgi:hypothetical protein
MPDGLEYIVRPFTTPGPHGTTIIPSTPSGSRERATLTWGAAADMPARSEIAGVNFEVVCCKESLSENDRKTEKIRVFQTLEDGTISDTNWIDYERPISMRLKKAEENKCGDDWDQISGVAQSINTSLDQFSDDIHSGTVSKSAGNCATSWSFKNLASGF